MPVIKPRTRGKQLVRHITRLDRENNETLYAYAHVPRRADRVRAQSAHRHGARQGQGVRGVARGTSGVVRAAARASIEAHEAVACGRGSRAARTSSRHAVLVAGRRVDSEAKGDDRCCDAMLGARGLIAMLIAAAIGAWGLHAYPVQTDNVVPGADCAAEAGRLSRPRVRVRHALVHDAILRGVARDVRRSRSSRIATRGRRGCAPLPPYPEPESRPTPTLVLGESAFRAHAGPRARPRRG